jgi:hypothetical protein
MRTVLLGDLEQKLHRIRQYIDKEENPIKKAKMLDRYRKISRALTTNKLKSVSYSRYHQKIKPPPQIEQARNGKK